MSDTELRVLIEMTKTTTEGEQENRLSPVRFMLAIRQLLPLHGWQVLSSVQRARERVFDSANMSGFEEHVKDIVEQVPAPNIKPNEARKFLTSDCGLSGSEAELLLLYCDVSEEDDTALDVSLLHDLLFAETIESSALYPLLATCFSESVAVPNSAGVSGSLSLLEGLRAARLCDARDTWESLLRLTTSVDLNAWLQLCRSLNCVLSLEDSKTLFHFLGETAFPLQNLLQVYLKHFPSVSLSTFDIIKTSVSKQIAVQSDLVFVQLFDSFESFGSSAIPLEEYVNRVSQFCRKKGALLQDIDVEYLRLKAPSRVDLLLLLCGPCPSKRESAIRKVYDCLSRTSKTNSLTAEAAVDEFKPETVDGKPLRDTAARWKVSLTKYIESLETTDLTYELFAFFWYMISAAVEDDPTFTLILWKAYALAERPMWK
ncbi:hypothetical protein AGDE_05723 [Angomonas deanei]|uniref:Uncharacterized protein n=1 Tax=Angomonas deanei TaxID=59799 RepID=A0A7G2CSR2_9TRYP|nr:hypothetical protein AGDE_05723 [Angomonas deanei]CAD2222359.1 hypothetical protein, conserved [Angomonas deanei]|eukprot:EPY38208.1 hypothetical protein AGDE_05723 [Angomonas deanei]